MLKILITSLVFCLTVSFFPAQNSSHAFEPWPISELIGTKAPDFTLRDISGTAINLSSFEGKPILLNFWATWCPYCRKERAHLNALYSEYKDRELIIISVSIDRSVSAVKKYLKKVPSDFIILSDSDSRVASKYSVVGLPSSFLIDRSGIVQYKFTGSQKWTGAGSKKLIDRLIKN